MNKKYIVIAVAVVLFAGVAFYLWQSGSPVAREVRATISLSQDVAPVTLSASEQQALNDAGLAIPTGADDGTTALQNVRTSDGLSAIESDLNDTDLSGLDAELNQIQTDVSGL